VQPGRLQRAESLRLSLKSRGIGLFQHPAVFKKIAGNADQIGLQRIHLVDDQAFIIGKS
jgi:hypothetical protein